MHGGRAIGVAAIFVVCFTGAGCLDSGGTSSARSHELQQVDRGGRAAAGWAEGRQFELRGSELMVRTDRRDRLAPGRVVEVEGTGGIHWRRIVEFVGRRRGANIYETVPATFAEALPRGRVGVGSDVPVPDPPESDDAASAVRTVTRALEGAVEEASTFGVLRDLGELEALQLAGEGLEVSTSGTLRMEPGYKTVVETSGGEVDTFEFTVMDQPQLELDWTFEAESTPGESPVTVEAATGLCENDDCGGSFTMSGRTFVVEPRIRLRVRARKLRQGGTFRLALRTDPSRHYLLGGVVYDRETGWRTRWARSFDVEVEAVEAPDAFAGELDVAFDVGFVLRPANDDSPMARIDLLELRDRIDARVSPPRCAATQQLEVRAGARRSSTPSEPTCLAGDSSCLTEVELFEERILNSQHAFRGDHPSCELTAPDCSGLDGGEACVGEERTCVHGRCIHRTPIRVTLAWNRGTDLDLVVWDDDGRKLRTRDRGLSADVDGWIAHRSPGGGGGRQKHYEIAVLRRGEARRPISVQVRRDGESSGADPVDYDLLVKYPEAFESIRTIDSVLEGRERSMRYRISGPAFVGSSAR